MILSRLLLVGLATVAFATACGAASAPQSTASASQYTSARATTSPPALQVASIGDNCLVGRWNLFRESDTTTIGQEVVALSGLGGTKMTISPDGTQTYDYNASEPLLGTYGGQKLTETFRGTATFHLVATATTLAITAVSSSAIVTAALNGKEQGSGPLVGTRYASPLYTCNTDHLELSFDTGAHTSFVRA